MLGGFICNMSPMDPMQEILETVREIRKGQLEQLAWRKRYLLKVRIISILLGFPRIH